MTAGKTRSRHRPYHSLLALQAAGQRGDDVAVVRPVGLGVRGAGDAQDVTEELHHRVLQAAARPEEGHVVPPRPAHRVVYGVVIGVRRAGHQPDALEVGQVVHLRAVGGYPCRLDVGTEHAAYGIQLAVRGMCGEFVANQGDPCHHPR